MIAIITPSAKNDSLRRTIQLFSRAGYHTAIGRNADGDTTVAAYGLGQEQPSEALFALLPDGVIAPALDSMLLTSRKFLSESTAVQLGGVTFGRDTTSIIAGPCAVEDVDSFQQSASGVADVGVGVLRGGAYKPRTSPYSFRGYGRDAVRILHEQGEALGVPVVTELLAAGEAEFVAAHCDMVQIGTRNMANHYLIEAAAATGKPILLKRGFAATVDELLYSAESALAAGAEDVILCERGIRSFDQSTRNVLDVVTIAELSRRTHLPVIADPSHATGRRDLVIPATLAALAAGADGVLVEVHHNPDSAIVDGPQSLSIAEYRTLVESAQRLLPALGRRLALSAAGRNDTRVVA